MFQNYKNSGCKERGPQIFIIFLCTVFLLTCLKMAYVLVETYSMHVKVSILNKLNLCCVRRNVYGLFTSWVFTSADVQQASGCQSAFIPLTGTLIRQPGLNGAAKWRCGKAPIKILLIWSYVDMSSPILSSRAWTSSLGQAICKPSSLKKRPCSVRKCLYKNCCPVPWGPYLLSSWLLLGTLDQVITQN